MNLSPGGGLEFLLPCRVRGTLAGGLWGTVEGLSRPVLPRVPWGPNLGQSGGGGGGVQSQCDETCKGPIDCQLFAGGRPTSGTKARHPAPGEKDLVYSRSARWDPPGVRPKLGARHRAHLPPCGLGTPRGRCVSAGSLASGQGRGEVLLGTPCTGRGPGLPAWVEGSLGAVRPGRTREMGSGQWGAVSSCSELVGVF